MKKYNVQIDDTTDPRCFHYNHSKYQVCIDGLRLSEAMVLKNSIKKLTLLEEAEEKLESWPSMGAIPPTGLVPKSVWQKQRFKEICEAMSRYVRAGKPFPFPYEWVREHKELFEILP